MSFSRLPFGFVVPAGAEEKHKKTGKIERGRFGKKIGQDKQVLAWLVCGR
jgi:hypothetical protein